MLKILFSLVCLTSFLMNGQKQTQSIGFIENKGQIIDQKGRKNSKVKFLLNSNGLNVQLRQNGFSYDVYEIKKHPLTKKQKERLYPSNFLKEDTLINPNYSLEYIYHRIDIDFKNSNTSVQLIAEEKSSDYDNYYNVPNEPNGILDVHKYQKVTYENIYDNIDVVFFIPEDKTKPLEYNFIVKPNAYIDDIQLEFKGAKTELVDNKIKMNVRFGQMEETLPLSWTEKGINKNEIAIGYKKLKNNVYGFESNNDLTGKKIIIDPTPVRLWGTYYGGNGGDYSSDICNDSNNNVYISGYTWSTINIATSGAFIISTEQYYRGDGFIAKFDSNGSRIWGIYYSVHANTIKVDSNENLYFTGTMDTGFGTTNVATPGSHQSLEIISYNTTYLVKLNSLGIREWGTYYGGGYFDFGNDISFDNQNNIYLVGKTNSFDHIATSGTYQLTHANGYMDSDGFIAKFTPQGIRVWGTYFGGTGSDNIVSCDVSSDGYLYITGNTDSSSDIATPNSYQTNLVGYGSGMLAKFDLNGQRIWGSYLVGETISEIKKSKLKDNFLYITGITNSHTNINSLGTFNEIFIDLPMYYGYSSFVLKFDTNSQNQVWGTYFGDFIQDIDISSSNKIFFTGCTELTNGIATNNSYSTTIQLDDAYLIKLNENGQRIWGTYYGGNNIEGINGAANVCNKMSLDSLDNIYLVGNTDSTTGISTHGAHQENYSLNSLGGLYNVFLAKFQDCLSSPFASSNTPTCIGTTLNLTASGGTNYTWTGPNGFTSNLQNPTIPNANTSHSGQYSCLITGTGGCDGTNTINVVVGDSKKPIPNINPLPSINGDCNTTISIPTATDNCAGSIIATTTDPLAYTLPGNYTINWNYDDGNGNIETQTQTVTITAVALPTVSSPQNFCVQQNATLNSITITGQNIKWYDSLTTGNLITNTTSLVNGTTYYASQTINGCESLRSPVTINIQNTIAPTGNATQSFCSTQNATLSDIVISGTNINWYNSATSTALLPSTTLLVNGSTYYATQTVSGCESIGRLSVTISLINTLNATDYSETLCDNLNDGFETINLINYQSNLITNTPGCTFEYYNSQNGADNQVITEQINTPSNYNLTVGSHTLFVRITSTNTCHQTVKLILELFSNPVITIPDIVPLCDKSNVTVNAGAGFSSYQWSTGATTQSVSITQPGNYNVTVNQNHGSITCSSTKIFQVVLSNIATILNIETIDMSSNDENIIMVNLDTNSLGDYEYSIDGIHYQDSNTFTNLSGGDYTIYVKDKNGCGITKDEVFLLTYPKFFTPNGDGYNDTWKIKFSEIENGLTVKIFDRYGKLLKTLDNKTAWDGTYNNNRMISDDYWFVIYRANGKEHRGHFTLKR